MPTTLESHVLVVFGATGDLAHRKVLPSLFDLFAQGTTHGKSVVLGVARAGLNDGTFRASLRESLLKGKGEAAKGKNEGGGAGKVDAAKADGAKADGAKVDAWLDGHVYFQSLGEADDAAYTRLAARVLALEAQHKLEQHRIFYLALPVAAFPTTINALAKAGLHQSAGWTRLVIEKPFGHDLASAQELNAVIHRWFSEEQVYRLDHYLGKETVQNLLALRFGNSLFEPIWNRDRVKQVEITVAEELGVEGRGSFYEKVGAVRDIMQNHMMQLLCLTAMEPPSKLDGNSVANEKVKVLEAMSPIDPATTVLGQYNAGEANGKSLLGYRQEKGVDSASTTETYAATVIMVNNWRWNGVPFFLRTGKRLARKASRIVVTFHQPPAAVFNPYVVCGMASNRLEITLQPNEGFNLAFVTKIPGEGMHLSTQEMRFRYADVFGELPEAYQTLMLDVMRGDHTLFVRNDEVEKSWRLFAPLLEHPPALQTYEAGSWGPAKTASLLAENGCCWTDV